MEALRIKLSNNNKYAIVSKCDYDQLMEYKWYCDRSGYAIRTTSGLKMHRVVLDCKAGDVVDHINGDKLDNRRENLRLCSVQENTFNRRPDCNGASKYKGVVFDKKKKLYRVRISCNGESKYLGRFKSEEKAAMAYNVAASKYFGQFAYLNKI